MLSRLVLLWWLRFNVGTHHVTAERRPGVQDAAGRWLSVEEGQSARVANASFDGLLAPLLSLGCLRTSKLNLPAKELVEEAKVGLDENWTTVRMIVLSDNSPFSLRARVTRYASIKPIPRYFIRYAMTILALLDTPTR